MATTTLVGDLIAVGREIITRLEQAGIDIDTALWVQDEDSGDWRLMLASEYVDLHGPRRVYELLANITRTSGLSDLRLDDVRVFGTSASFIRDVKGFVRTNDDLHNIRLSFLSAGGQTFKAAHIYRARGGSLGQDARVRVKANGRLGSVRNVRPTPHGTRYLVMYDVRPGGAPPLGATGPFEAGQDFAADELDFLYSGRPGE